jgi:hypothetical protein
MVGSNALNGLPSTAPLKSVSCPRCAGPLHGADGERHLACGHCGTYFLATSTRGYARRFFPAKVAKLGAVAAGTRWLHGYPDAPSDIEEAAFVEAYLLYAPIWEVRAHVVGWEFGKKIRTRAEAVTNGDETYIQMNMVEESSEEGFLNERRLYQEAADLGAIGMRRPHITGREFTLPYLPGELEADAAVLQATGDLDAAEERAHTSFLKPPTGAIARSSRLFLLKERSALIYYPLWELRYRYRGRSYEMTVDGRTGVVHSARAPADNRRRVATFLGIVSLLAIVLAFGVWFGGTSAVGRELSLYVGAAVAVLAGGAAWRFELVREVEYHEPFSS